MRGEPPPFDRAVALACSMTTLRGRWLDVRCSCGAVACHPIRLMLAADPRSPTRSLADVLVLLRCHECGARPRSIHLAETAHGTGLGMPKGIDVGWALLLHGPPGPDWG